MFDFQPARVSHHGADPQREGAMGECSPSQGDFSHLLLHQVLEMCVAPFLTLERCTNVAHKGKCAVLKPAINRSSISFDM